MTKFLLHTDVTHIPLAPIHQKIYDCRPSWGVRQGDKSCIYYLGGASYMTDYDAYESIERMKPLMKPFEPELNALRSQIAELLQGEVFFDPRLGLPGFQIFTENRAKGGKVHIDGQILKTLEVHGVDAMRNGRVFSVSFCIEAPSQGGGLRFWSHGLVEFSQLWKNIRLEPPPPEVTVAMEPGTLVIFDGGMIHQIEPFMLSKPSSARITCCGHLAEVEHDRFVFFW